MSEPKQITRWLAPALSPPLEKPPSISRRDGARKGRQMCRLISLSLFLSLSCWLFFSPRDRVMFLARGMHLMAHRDGFRRGGCGGGGWRRRVLRKPFVAGGEVIKGEIRAYTSSVLLFPRRTILHRDSKDEDKFLRFCLNPKGDKISYHVRLPSVRFYIIYFALNSY